MPCLYKQVTGVGALDAITESSSQVGEGSSQLGPGPATSPDESKRVFRPWGYYESLAIGKRFQVKRIVVKPGGRLSLQKHHHRSEHWTVAEGAALVTCNNRTIALYEDQTAFIAIGALHRLENPGLIPLTLIEVQVGAYLGEDDIIRLEDDYGRR